MKTYNNYKEILQDFEYHEGLDNRVEERTDFRRRGRYFRHRVYQSDEELEEYSQKSLSKAKKEFRNTVECKYWATAKKDNKLGRFIAKYKLPFREFICVVLTAHMDDGEFDFFDEIRSENALDKLDVDYDRSRLKIHKLIFKVVNPLIPMKVKYKVSYKAQLELQGKPYTDAYRQLDLQLEEESKRNTPDEMNSLYYIIRPKEGFDALVVSKKLKDSLKAAMAREKQHNKIFKKWGFDNVLEYGKGTTLNFRGPPGTGKTLAASCLAKELGKELLMVRYDQLQNCWVGQTEKHIQQVFKLAKAKNAVLFFDEADAIALSRKTLERSWEMSQVNTLLKELERFEGVCIFATNFAEKYDEAFERRLTMHVDFEMPSTEQRTRIMDKLLPNKSRDKNVSLQDLKLENFSGGDMKNVSLNAAGVAASQNSTKIMQKHLEEAVTIVRKAKQKSSLEEPKYYG